MQWEKKSMEMISNGFRGIVDGMENGDEDNLKQLEEGL